jgi:ADP-L-glycero-D-manno-heptose 6-epimerase
MIIVTGAAGFIGSVLVHYLNSLGVEDLLLVDRLGTDERWRNLRGARFSQMIYPEELFDHSVWQTPQKIKAVYHMGACSDTTETDMDYLYENNTLYTQLLFGYCTKAKVPFCYASSAATYGAGEEGYVDAHDKTKNLKPLNKYGWSKQLADEWVLSRPKSPPLWFGVKFFNVFGPHEAHKGKMSSVVYHGHQQIQSQGRIKLFKSYKNDFKDGEQLRDFVYVKDIVRAMVEMMSIDYKKCRKVSGLYNLGTSQARTFIDLAKATFAGHGKKAEIELIEMPESLRSQYQYYTQADMTKFFKLLPKFKFLSLEEAVKDYVQNHLVADKILFPTQILKTRKKR